MKNRTIAVPNRLSLIAFTFFAGSAQYARAEQAGPDGPPVPEASSATSVLEEIVVTAQKRSQTAQDIPLSMTVMTGDQIAQLHLQQASDLAAYSPGLHIKNSLGDQNPIFTIRGIGLNSFFAPNDPTTSVYVNEVFVPYHPMMSFQLFDIERVEVLKGPQGTLYGRNTTSGAVNFHTRRPSSEFSGYADLSYGSYEDMRFEGAVTGPLSDAVAGRLAVFSRQRDDGWLRTRVTGEKIGKVDRTALRGQLLFTSGDSVEIRLEAHGARDRSDFLEGEHIGTLDLSQPPPPGAFGAPCAPVLEGRRAEGECTNALGYFDPDDDPFMGDWNPPHTIHTDYWGGGLTIEWNFPAATLTSVTGYQSFERDMRFNGFAEPVRYGEEFLRDEIVAWSEEIRLASKPDSEVDWIVGLVYSDDAIEGFNNGDSTDLLGTVVGTLYDDNTRAAAAFANGGWWLTPRWKLNAGVRYTHEEKDFDHSTVDYNPDGASFLLLLGICRPPEPQPGLAQVCNARRGSLSDSDVSGTIGVDLKPNENWLVYAKLSRGFKSGGVNAAILFDPAQLIPYGPEELFAAEAGFKSTLLDGRMRLNMAVFGYDWRDVQTFTARVSGPLPVQTLSNAGDAEVLGVEAEWQWKPVEQLELAAAVNWNDTEVVEFNTDVPVSDLTGNVLANTPEYSLTGLIRYTQPLLHAGLQIYAQTDFSWRDEVYFDVENTPILREPSLWLVNARIGVRSADERWELAIWGRNLGDERYAVDTVNGAGLGADLRFYGEPRTVGVTGTYRF